MGHVGFSDRGKQILYDWNYGGAGYFSINSPDDWEDNLKKWVEGAIKEYAEANGLSRKQWKLLEPDCHC